MSRPEEKTEVPTASIETMGDADQALDQVDVVDHQVEHDVDVGAALAERREPMGLDEARRAQRAGERQDRRIESLEVADLQDAADLRAASSTAPGPRSIVSVIGFSTSTCTPRSRHSRAIA